MTNNRTPGVDTLQSNQKYRLILEIEFQDMIPFVMKNIRERGAMSMAYFAINIIMLGLIILQLLLGLLDHSFTWKLFLSQSILGLIAGSILVIPIHEILHGLAYKLLGARKITFGADLKQLIFFVTADRHPVTGSQIHFLALLPFVLINLSTLALSLSLFPAMLLFSSFFLLSHNLMCIGDFAISNYVHRTKNRLFSYDEPENKKSYFYELIKEVPTSSLNSPEDV